MQHPDLHTALGHCSKIAKELNALMPIAKKIFADLNASDSESTEETTTSKTTKKKTAKKTTKKNL